MSIRRAQLADIPAIMAIEQIPGYQEYIGRWSAEQHRSVMESGDAEYFIAVTEDATDKNAVEGFAILQDLLSEHRSILLKRIAVRTPNRGTGRALLRFVMDRVFEHHRAHRLCLDVFVTNTRARHTYESFGFREEGILRESKLRDGEYHSQVLMSLLEHEYRAQHDRVTDSSVRV
jgi:diamine N-acetyltransferase